MIEKILIDNILKEQEEHDKKIRSGKFNPSCFGQCYRRQIWNRMNLPKSNPIGIETLKVFRAGKLFHDMIQQLLPINSTEVLVEEEDIKGFADIVMEEEVVDIKSQKSFAFTLMAKKGFNLFVDKIEHVLQVSYYAWKLGKKDARMVYINKDTIEIKEFSINVGMIIPKIEEEISILRNWWGQWQDKKEFPPASPRLYKGKECTYCQFENTCKGKQF